MSTQSAKKEADMKPTNNQIIKEYLDYYESESSKNTRKSCLNYFFKNKYFGYSGHIFDVDKRKIMEYFKWLNKNTSIALNTKKLKWSIFRSFLDYTIDFYDDEYNLNIRFPSRFRLNWKNTHKKPESNKNVYMTLDDLKKILDYLKLENFKYYLIFRIFAETGMRKKGLRKIDYDKINLEKRYIETIEKTGRKIYYFSQDLVKYLKIFIKERKEMKIDTKALFISSRLKRYGKRAFNLYLKRKLNEIGIKKNITCHTFRKSLNNFREEMGCGLEKRSILINHAINGVNFNSYVAKNYEKFIRYYDKWNPYTKNGINL
jgi:integrase